MGPTQVSKEFYNQKFRTLFGLGIYYLNEKTNSIEYISFDVISELPHSGESVVRCLRLLRRQQFFKKIDKKSYFFWSDVGTHFKNNQLAHYCFIELAEEAIMVNLNFFAPKHGMFLK